MSPLRAALIVSVSVSALAALQDLRTRHISDALTLGVLVLAPLAHAAASAPRGLAAAATALVWSLSGVVACGLVPLLLFRAGAMGGGDVKLLAALGAVLQPLLGVELETYAFVAAALYGPARMAYEGKLFRTLANTVMLAINPLLPEARRRPLSVELMAELAFGPAVFVAAGVTALTEWR